MKISILIVVIFLTIIIYANINYSDGIIGMTLRDGGTGCVCHNSIPSGSVSVWIEGMDSVFKGDTVQYKLLMTGGSAVAGGFNIASYFGELSSSDTLTKVLSGELTHTFPNAFVNDTVYWDFFFIAPDSLVTDTLYSVANSVNGNGNPTGDQWNFGENFPIYILDQPTFALSVNIEDGWNMVSVPGTNPAGMGVTTWWPGKDPAADVFKYSGGYVAVTTTAPSEGYWMKNAGAQVYNYTDIQIVPHTDVPLVTGWNLFGLYEVTEPTATLQTSPPGIITGSIFEYSGGYNPATDIVPGYGYWVKSTGPGSIVNLTAPPLGKGSGEVVEWFPEDWGKILLTDASGINYTLYAVKGKVDLNKYELPPMPPTGMFDIRYGSGRIAEDINSSMQTIDMSGVTYPLTVRVDGMDIRLMDETGKTINVNLKSGEDVVISDATIQKLMVTGELLPTVYALEQNYPNPFNPSTTIEFSLPEDVSNVKLSIYNALGERVAELVNSSLTAGKYQYQWNAQNVATGMYIYELRTDKFVSVKKMILMK
ncbi:MAG: T9SS type A sorting domain-containing protein [Ignavibacteria bacterium]|nr:T9SS type A sorting domain-containing protein [Ignavibacteria bacterium]